MLVSYQLRKMLSRLALAVCAMAFLSPTPAWAQWQWIDAQGQRVFSDRPPGNDIPEKNILQRPKSGPSVETTKTVTAVAATPVTASKTSDLPTIDKNKAAVQELNAQLADQNKAIRARNCADARRSLETLKSGGRIARINDKGEREFLDDAAIAAEVKQVQRVADSECR